jgi:hypothetical protein
MPEHERTKVAEGSRLDVNRVTAQRVSYDHRISGHGEWNSRFTCYQVTSLTPAR